MNMTMGQKKLDLNSALRDMNRTSFLVHCIFLPFDIQFYVVPDSTFFRLRTVPKKHSRENKAQYV